MKKLLDKLEGEYNVVPYHNWQHGKSVAWAVSYILEDQSDRLLKIAWLAHDAWHTWTANSPIDEEYSCKIAHDIMLEEWYSSNQIGEVQRLIIATIFSDRWDVIDPDAQVLVDADISIIGSNYKEFLYSAWSLLLENHPVDQYLTDTRIIDFFQNDQQKFFSYLTSITWDVNNPFLTEWGRKKFPNFAKNKDLLLDDIEENPNKLIELIRTIENTPNVVKYRNSKK